MKAEMRFYATRGRPRDLGVFRTLTAVKFAVKGVVATAAGRPAAASSCLRIIRACLAPPGRWSTSVPAA